MGIQENAGKFVCSLRIWGCGRVSELLFSKQRKLHRRAGCPYAGIGKTRSNESETVWQCFNNLAKRAIAPRSDGHRKFTTGRYPLRGERADSAVPGSRRPADGHRIYCQEGRNNQCRRHYDDLAQGQLLALAQEFRYGGGRLEVQRDDLQSFIAGEVSVVEIGNGFHRLVAGNQAVLVRVVLCGNLG